MVGENKPMLIPSQSHNYKPKWEGFEIRKTPSPESKSWIFSID